MNRSKKKTSQLLALFVAAMLVFSNFGSIAVAATSGKNVTGGGSDCGIDYTAESSEYKHTENLTNEDKSDNYQKNSQRTDLTENEGYYTNLLLQSAEWTNKENGEAELNIHYTADLETSANRAVYVFTTCTGHGFTERTAIENIIELLQYNEYVDVIMVGANNRASAIEWTDNDASTTSADAAAAKMFTLKASDFDYLDDGREFLTDNGSTYEGKKYGEHGDIQNNATKAYNIWYILEADSNEALINERLVHEIGCTAENCNCNAANYYVKDSTYVENEEDRVEGHYYDGKSLRYGPYIEILYSNLGFSNDGAPGSIDYFEFEVESQTYTSAAEFVLDFGSQRHAGELFTLYYIAEYINIIEEEYGTDSFNSTVRAIFNSFDAFATSSRNLDEAFPTDILYEQLKKYVGVDLASVTEESQIDLEDLNSDCQDAVRMMQEYTQENSYIVLIPDDGVSNSNIYNFGIDFDENGTNDYLEVTPTKYLQAVNTLLYSLILINPVETANDSDYARSLIEDWIADGTVLTFEDFRVYNENVYTYSQDLATSGALSVLYDPTSVTITTTIDSEFEIDTDGSGDRKIEVRNSGAANSSFDYEVVSVAKDDDGNTVVTIKFTNLSTDDEENNTTDDWVIDISISVSLDDEDTDFRTENDEFKDTNGSGADGNGAAVTTAAVYTTYSTSTDDSSTSDESSSETGDLSEATDDSSSGETADTGTLSGMILLNGDDEQSSGSDDGTSDTTETTETTETIVTTHLESVTVDSPKLYKAPGSLTISKTVSGDATSEEKAQSYEFAVSLTGANNSAISGTYDITYYKNNEQTGTGKITFGEEGTVTEITKETSEGGSNTATSISLADGESITIWGLLAGTSYTVAEDTTGIAGHCEYRINDIPSDEAVASGIITDGKTSTAAFNNHFEAGTLTISKTFSSNTELTDEEKSTEFSFEIELKDSSDSAISGTYKAIYSDQNSNETSGTITFDNGSIVAVDGNTATSISLKHDESITIYGLPSGAEYTVTEINADDYATTVDGGEENTKVATGTIVEHETLTAAFNNRKSDVVVDTGTLEVTKAVTGSDTSDSDKEFTFTVTLDEFLTGQYKDMYFENGVAVITLTNGESKQATGLPAGTSYTVTESDNEGYKVTATVNNKEVEADSTGEIIAKGTITAAATDIVAFQNHKDVSPKLSIEKTGSVTTAEVGETIDYTLTVEQTVAGATATGVIVTDEIPEGLTYVEDSVEVTVNGSDLTSAASVSDGILTVNLGDVAYGDEIEIVYQAVVDEGTEGQSLKNVAKVTSDNAGEDEDDWTVDVPEEDPIEEEPTDEGDDPSGDPEEGSDDDDEDEDEGTDSDDPGTSETDGDDTTGTDGSDDSSDDATVDEADDDDATKTSILPQTGDSTGVLLPFVVALALGAFATAAVAAFTLRKRRIF